MTEQQKTELVPCSNCGAPVLPNLAECMFCGQLDPGKLASNPVGRKFVETKQNIRKRRRAAEENVRRSSGAPSFALPESIGQYRYLFQGAAAVTHTIAASYVFLYLFSLLLDLRGATWWVGLFGIALPSSGSLLSLGATGSAPVLGGRVWTFLTAPYLHTGLLDVAIGTIFLIQLGRMTERFYGNAPFYLIYTAAGVAGGVVATVAGMPLATTPRTALFGLFAAVIVYTRNQFDPMSRQIMQQMAIFGFVLLLIDLLGPWQLLLADITGALAGLAMATFLLKKPELRYDQLTDRIARLLGLATAVFVAVSLVSSFLL